MGFPQRFLDEVRRADPLRVIGEVVDLKRRGSRYVGLCPFHQEKTPSFSVSDEGLWYCFGCDAGGDLIRFVMEYEGLEFVDAVEAIAGRCGIPIPEGQDRPSDVDAGEQRVGRRRILEALQAADEFYRGRLEGESGERARRFLQARGFTASVIDRFGLGYAPDGWEAVHEHLAVAGFEDRVQEAAGLVKRRDGGRGCYDRLRDRVVFPIRDLRGRTIAFGGRIIDEGEPKYLNSPETPVFSKSRTLYGMDLARPALRDRGFVLLVEGYFDLLACAQHGFPNVVAPLGTSFNTGHAEVLDRLVDKAVVCFDGDDAGLDAAERTVGVFMAQGFHVNVVRVPPGEDPDSLLMEEGPEALTEALRDSQSALEFLAERAGERTDLGSPQGKADALERLLEYVLDVDNRVERAEWIGRVAERLELERHLVERAAEEVRDRRRTRRRRGREGGERGGAGDGGDEWRRQLLECPPAERRLLRALLRRPEWHEEIVPLVGLDAIRDPRIRGLVESLEACRGEEVEPTVERLLERCDVEGADRLLAGLRLERGEPPSLEEARNCALGIRRDALKREVARLRRAIARAQGSGDTGEVDELSRELVSLTQEIEDIDRGDPVFVGSE